MNSSKQILPLVQNIYRHVARNASSGTFPVSGRYTQFLSKRARLEVPDETPIHIKNSFLDKALCQTTWILAALGTGLALETLYNVISGKKA